MPHKPRRNHRINPLRKPPSPSHEQIWYAVILRKPPHKPLHTPPHKPLHKPGSTKYCFNLITKELACPTYPLEHWRGARNVPRVADGGRAPAGLRRCGRRCALAGAPVLLAPTPNPMSAPLPASPRPLLQIARVAPRPPRPRLLVGSRRRMAGPTPLRSRRLPLPLRPRRRPRAGFSTIVEGALQQQEPNFLRRELGKRLLNWVIYFNRQD